MDKKLLLLLTLILPLSTFAQDYQQLTKIVASQRAPHNQFGYSIDIFGDYAIVGARFEDINAMNPDAGAAYIYKKDQGGLSNWGLVKRIVPAARDENDLFGFSVAISNEFAVVGVPYEENEGDELISRAGAVFIFQRDLGGVDNWGEVKKVTPSIRAADDQFGVSVAIENNQIVVGAWREDEDENDAATKENAGAVYVFRKDEGGTDNWGEVKKIVSADRAPGDLFGRSVALSGDLIVVGAVSERHNVNGGTALPEAGSAYIFKQDEGGTDNWGEVKKIVALDRAVGAQFGVSAAVDVDQIIVGAWRERKNRTGSDLLDNAGAAYIYRKDKGGINNWGQVKKIVAFDREQLDQFGFSVSISGDRVIVGAYQEDENPAGNQTLSVAGSAYLYERELGGAENWGLAKKIVPTDRAEGDQFGFSVAIDGDFAAIGARYDDKDVNGGMLRERAGSAYIFQRFTVLPVELIYFQGKAKDSDVQLDWATASETHNKGFEVQWSRDAKQFKAVDFLKGAGNSLTQQNYTYSHEDVPSGINYYRLNQIDLAEEGGKTTYSHVIAVEVNSIQNNWKILENPTSDLLQLSEVVNAPYHIFEVNGQWILSGRLDGQTIAIHQLPSGSYMLKIKNRAVQFVKK
ncbi:MAG: hypothetical protein AAGI23_11755 [Bacteroidota bacterium]